MRVETARAVLVSLVCTTGCSFDLAAVAGDADAVDAPDLDAPPAVTVGFAGATTPADEASGPITIPVTISAPAAVTVAFAVTGGTAVRGTDFTGPDGMLVFAGGTTSETIPLTILADATDESAETIVITLSSPIGASLGTSTHTVSISANTVPRVNLMMSASTGVESSSPTITFTLTAKAPTDVTVDYTLGGTAAPAGMFQDFSLVAGTVTFPAGTTVQTRSLGVQPDTRDELDETVTITLTNPVGIIPGATSVQTHTITDDDAPPTVTLTIPANQQTPNEGNTTATLTATLSTISGQTVTVPWTVGGTATGGAGNDYTLASTADLVFPEGTTTRTITVNVLEDMMPEPDETVIVTLGTPTNAGPGATMSRTITIIDDDRACQGTGNYEICFVTAPIGARVLPAMINTDPLSTDCELALPPGWANPQGQPDSCFVYATNITTTQVTRVTGSRPLVLVATGTIDISFPLDASSRRTGGAGAGSPSGQGSCKVFPVQPDSTSSGGGGGAGATFMSVGGIGGTGDTGGSNGGTPPTIDAAAPTFLRGGCNGQRGGNGDVTAGAAGRGGGVVYLVAGTSISIDSVINASGAGATGGGDSTGGSGGGSGGMIKLYAPAITVTGATLFANGGGGAEGGDDNDTGTSGSDSLTATSAASGGTAAGGSRGGDGGDGYATPVPAGSGSPGGSSENAGGGGGGGGGGYIQSNLALTGATVSAGSVDAP